MSEPDLFQYGTFKAMLDKRDWKEFEVGSHYLTTMFPKGHPDETGVFLKFFQMNEVPSTELATEMANMFIEATGKRGVLLFLTILNNQNSILHVKALYHDYEQHFDYSTGVLDTIKRH